MVVRLPPNGSARLAGVMAPQAMTPKPPALEMAATRFFSLTQLIAPPMMATRQPKKPVPLAHSRSSSARAGDGAAAVTGGGAVSEVSGEIAFGNASPAGGANTSTTGG